MNTSVTELTSSRFRLIIQSFCIENLKVGQKLGIFKDEIFKCKIQSFSCLKGLKSLWQLHNRKGTQMEQQGVLFGFIITNVFWSHNHKSIRFSNPFFQFRIQFHNGGGLQGCWAQVQLKTLKIPAASGLVKLTRLVPGVVHRQGSILPCQHHSFPLWLVTAKVFWTTNQTCKEIYFFHSFCHIPRIF